MIVFILGGLSSLSNIFGLNMDVHNKFKTSLFNKVIPRFNERFILSLASCRNCIVMNNEYNLLPISAGIVALKAVHEYDTVII